MRHVVITASATADGRPLYMLADGGWSPELARGHVARAPDERDRMLEQARGDEFTVCDPYAIEVTIAEGWPRPVSLRESIRAGGGPTFRKVS